MRTISYWCQIDCFLFALYRLFNHYKPGIEIQLNWRLFYKNISLNLIEVQPMFKRI